MTSFSPVAWTPRKAPVLEGVHEKNTKLAGAARLEVSGIGPEDVVIDGSGTVVAGLEDGRLMRFPAGGGAAQAMADVGGRPLGIELSGDDLLVCNADLGLQLVSSSGAFKTLVESLEGERLLFPNNATVHRCFRRDDLLRRHFDAVDDPRIRHRHARRSPFR